MKRQRNDLYPTCVLGGGRRKWTIRKRILNEDTFMFIEFSGVYKRKGAGLELG